MFLHPITKFTDLLKITEQPEAVTPDDSGDVGDVGVDETQLFDFPLSKKEVTTTENFVNIDYVQFEKILKRNYFLKKSTFISGPPGLGKSAIMETTAKQIAPTINSKKTGKPLTYINFKSINEDNTNSILENISEYFIFMDLRTASMEPSDMQGIPDIKDSIHFLKFKLPLWAYICTRPNSFGFLFFDEMNQGRDEVLSTLFSVANDEERKVGSPPISLGEGWGVFGAGNIGPKYRTQAIPLPLINRFACYNLVTDPESWFRWAEKNKVSNLIIGFVRSNPKEYFHREPEVGVQAPFPSPRSFVALSSLIKHIIAVAVRHLQRTGQHDEDIYSEIYTDALATCGQEWAMKFRVYIEKIKDLTLEKIAKGNLMGAKGTMKEDIFIYIQYITDEVIKAFTQVEKTPTPEKEALLKSVMDFYIKIYNQMDDDEDVTVLHNKIQQKLGERFPTMILKYVKTDPKYADYLKKHLDLQRLKTEYAGLKS